MGDVVEVGEVGRGERGEVGSAISATDSSNEGRSSKGGKSSNGGNSMVGDKLSVELIARTNAIFEEACRRNLRQEFRSSNQRGGDISNSAT